MSEGRVLVIDDSEFVLARVKSVLAAAGYDVQTTTQTVGTGRYLRNCDLVLLDFHMPGIDGGQVLSSLRNAAQTASNPCSFYLFTSDEEVASRYASLGFDGVIRNKGDLTALAGQVRAAFRMNKMKAIARKKKPDSGAGLTPIPDVGGRGFSMSPPPEAGGRSLSNFPPALSDSGSDPGLRRPPPPRITADEVPGVFDPGSKNDDNDR
ncbi:MAG: response regulator [Polyangiaceae bacterium]|nr:response regulator [Polyangiaceae bacterium]